MVPDSNRRAGTGIRPSRNHRYAVCGCTPFARAHSANFTHSLKHTFDHVYSRIAEQFATPIPAIPLFPLASQIADKIIGVAFRDDQGRSANRYRDLVDLALYAGDVDVDADQLRDALRARAAARGQPLPTHLDVPDAWETPYRRVASKTTLQPALHNATTAAEAVGAWLNPVLAGEIQAGCVWDHRSGVWRHTSEPVARPGRVWVRPHMRDGRPVTDYFRRRPRH
ncbi:nucleotidyl transferase AbiEii/AbiGii toxin family protein [Mycobacterium xenopi]|uniref:nucleotidyl transferase AbiEii/AbiGii toxin family protein n=2 Tax=Mycobacterium xenopi TaxID=1789 RepID=UPI000DD77E96|nr:nucleotidyl transferase AbiEii/AbiGii toxin family protein [Mycobacterium xenopi]